MKRTPLKRGKPLARGSSSLKRSPMKRKRPRGQPPERKDREYLAWLRRQPCCMCSARTPNHTHHPRHIEGGSVGLGLKAPDQSAITLCDVCHGDLHGARGAFKDWQPAAREAWERAQNERQRALYERAQGDTA